MCRRLHFFLLTATVLATAGGGEPAQAQDKAEEEKEEQPVQPARKPTLTAADLEQWAYGPGGVDRARVRLEARLAWEIQKIDRIARLTPEQKKKLELAGRGDIKRRLDQIWERISTVGGGPVDRVQARGILVEMQRLNVDSNPQVFGDDSLFAKTLTRTLAPEQRARHAERQILASYQLRVQWVIFPLVRQLRMSPEQQRRFVAAIVEGTRPLKRYGELDEAAILLQAARLPEAKLRPIFNESQWRRLGPHLDAARRMEKVLIEQGYVDRVGAAVTRPAAFGPNVRRPAVGAFTGR
jgi:hypothetical protein